MSLPVGVVVSAHESVSAFSFAPLVPCVVDDIQKIARRSRQPVEPRDQKLIAFGEDVVSCCSFLGHDDKAMPP